MSTNTNTITRHDIHRKFITALRLWESNVNTSAQAVQVAEELGLEPEAQECLRERHEEAKRRYAACRAQYLEFCRAMPSPERAKGDVL